MLLHLIIAAALLSPGTSLRPAVATTVSAVCAMVAVDLDAAASSGRTSPRSSGLAATIASAPLRATRLVRPTTQLRQ